MAALAPVLLALTAIIGSIGLLDLLSHLVGMNSYANSVMLLMGLAVGVDYSLFFLFRGAARSGRLRAGTVASALQVAAATNSWAGGRAGGGGSVLVSRPDRDDRDGSWRTAVRHGHPLQGLGAYGGP